MWGVACVCVCVWVGGREEGGGGGEVSKRHVIDSIWQYCWPVLDCIHWTAPIGNCHKTVFVWFLQICVRHLERSSEQQEPNAVQD